MYSVNSYPNFYAYSAYPTLQKNIAFNAKPKADVVEIKKNQENTDKKGLSKGAKWGIGAAVVVLAALILTKGKGVKNVAKAAGEGASGMADDAAKATSNRIKNNVIVEDVSFEELPKSVQKAINEQEGARRAKATVAEVVEQPKASSWSFVDDASKTGKKTAESAGAIHKTPEVKTTQASSLKSAESLADDSVGAFDDVVDSTRRGTFGQDLYDPLDPRNEMDILSPYYKSELDKLRETGMFGDDLYGGIGGGFDTFNPTGF